MTATTILFSTYGSVRGCCGHQHKTRHAAESCLQNDHNACASQAGYSDRELVLVGSDGFLYRDMGQLQAVDGDHWIPTEGGHGATLQD